MKLRIGHCLLTVLVCGSLSPADGLTIYRIGGENAPRPELEGDYEFVQLSWSDVDPALHGSDDRLELSGEFARPEQLDSTVNLVPIIESKGGEVLNLVWIGWGPPQEDDLNMFDQDPNTIYLGDGHFASHGPPQKNLTFDFGSPLLLERIRFYPREKHLTDRFVESFRVGMSDGDPLKDGTRDLNVGRRGSELDFDIIYDIAENTDAVIELPLPTVPIRRLFFQAAENTRGIWEIAEFEIYGKGYAPFAEYVSNVIDLGAPASLGELIWQGEVDEGARVDLSMRSGIDNDPNTYWRSTFRGGERTTLDERGRSLNLASYNKLSLGAKAGITHDTENWAFWSAAYDFAAGQGTMVGAGPQQFVQIRADFTSSQSAAGQLDYLQFAVSIPPVASQALAEIVPVAAPAGEVISFTYKLKPNFEQGDLGFDSITIDTPMRAASVDAVRISDAPVEFEVIALEDVYFTVQIPRIDAQRTEELIEIDFQTEIFKFGTVFSGRIFDSRQPTEVPQSVTPGDADVLEESDRLSVDLVRLGESTINELVLTPRVFSPNGDGINDAVRIEYDLLNLDGAVPVQATLYDLSGRSLGVVVEAAAASGRFTAQWDGRDNAGKIVAPGLYLLRLSVDADKGEEIRQAVISVAY